MVRLSRCCTPVPGDEIVGFVTAGRGVSVHRSDCANAVALLVPHGRSPDRGRVGRRRGAGVFVASIEVEALDRARLLRDVSTVLSEHHVNIVSSFTPPAPTGSPTCASSSSWPTPPTSSRCWPPSSGSTRCTTPTGSCPAPAPADDASAPSDPWRDARRGVGLRPMLPASFGSSDVHVRLALASCSGARRVTPVCSNRSSALSTSMRREGFTTVTDISPTGKAAKAKKARRPPAPEGRQGGRHRAPEAAGPRGRGPRPPAPAKAPAKRAAAPRRPGRRRRPRARARARAAGPARARRQRGGHRGPHRGRHRHVGPDRRPGRPPDPHRRRRRRLVAQGASAGDASAPAAAAGPRPSTCPA